MTDNEFTIKLKEITEKHASQCAEIVRSAKCALGVLFLLSDEVRALGHNADRVEHNLRAAVAIMEAK